MARIRSIKPEFFTSEQVVECSTSARLLFVGMWCFCDDQGVHPASWKRLKMEIFPGDAFDENTMTGMISELLEQGLIREFSSEGRSYWYVTGWEHQKIDRPTAKYPAPEFDEDSSSSTISTSVSVSTSVSKDSDDVRKASRRAALPACELETILSRFNESTGRNQRWSDARKKQARARWRDRYFREHWQEALDIASRTPFLLGENDRGWEMDLEFFLRPDSVLKIMEGKYATSNGTTGTAATVAALRRFGEQQALIADVSGAPGNAGISDTLQTIQR